MSIPCETWTTGALPDSDTTVLAKVKDAEVPIWVAFHDGECWRTADGSSIQGPVVGWMDLYQAERILDGHGSSRGIGRTPPRRARKAA